MEDKIYIENFRWYPAITEEQLRGLMDAMAASDSKELILAPDLTEKDLYRGTLLLKYASPLLSKCTGVHEVRQEGVFLHIMILRPLFRGFMNSLIRKMQPPPAARQTPLQEDPFDALLGLEKEKTQPPAVEQPPFPQKNLEMLDFLKRTTPAQIEEALNQRVIGQSQLTAAVADFLYYHALRQIHPDLPSRPLLISGPSGSGKTEVWRVANQLYGSMFTIKVIDGSNLSCDGWAGSHKIDSYMDPAIVDGGILVVDEFDKLTKPKYSSGGENVSLSMQAEFLKLIEGEYMVTERKKQTNMTSKRMGFVLVGAFEELREMKRPKKSRSTSPIGFCAAAEDIPEPQNWEELTDEDFIAYGIMPEIVGRIAAKCTTKSLDDQAYVNIIRGAHSRVAAIEQVLRQYGTQISDVISNEELLDMIAASRNNRTGVRWVSAQVENRLLGAIREQGLFPDLQSGTAPARQPIH